MLLLALLNDKAVILVLEHEDEGHRYNLSDHVQEQDHHAIGKEILSLQGQNETIVSSLNEVEDKTVGVRYREDSKNNQ